MSARRLDTLCGWIAGIVLIPVSFLGCGAPGGPGAGTRPGFDSLELEASGGLVGLDRSVRIGPDGSVFVADRRRGLCAWGTASQVEMRELAQLAAEVEFDRKTTPSAALSQPCRDCVTYDLALIDASGVHRTTWVGVLREPDPRQALAGKLAAYLSLLEAAGSRKECPNND